jgi:hypothetical protein
MKEEMRRARIDPAASTEFHSRLLKREAALDRAPTFADLQL